MPEIFYTYDSLDDFPYTKYEKVGKNWAVTACNGADISSYMLSQSDVIYEYKLYSDSIPFGHVEVVGNHEYVMIVDKRLVTIEELPINVRKLL